MDDDEIQRRSEATVAFERALESLVLEHFSEGAVIEGTWRVRSRPNAVPDWTIEIAREPTVWRTDRERTETTG